MATRRRTTVVHRAAPRALPPRNLAREAKAGKRRNAIRKQRGDVRVKQFAGSRKIFDLFTDWGLLKGQREEGSSARARAAKTARTHRRKR